MTNSRSRLFILLAAVPPLLLTLSIVLPRSHSRVPPLERELAQETKIIRSPDLCENIYKTICGKKGTTRDRTGIVRSDYDGELLTIQIYEEIVRAHPTASNEEIDVLFVQKVYTQRRMERLRSAHRWVQQALQNLIDSQPEEVLSDLQKLELKDRVERTELQFPFPLSNYADEPDLLTKSDVFYERTRSGRTWLRVGGAFFQTSRSWFNMINTMAHELAHAIDPCELQFAGYSIPSYDGLARCFVDTGLVDSSWPRIRCGQKDQLSETFADWIAAQVSVEALSHFASDYKEDDLLAATANSVRDLCEPQDGDTIEDLEEHPSARIRIDQIFGRNPSIRGVLGCAPIVNGPKYCTFK